MYNILGIVPPVWFGVYRNTEEFREAYIPSLEADEEDEIIAHMLENAGGVFREYEHEFRVVLEWEEENRYGVQMAVLRSNETRDAARIFASIVQDAGLGVVIGKPLSQSPTHFGIGYEYGIFPHIDRGMWVSIGKFHRVNSEVDQQVLWPDIVVPTDEALDRAIAFFRGN